MGKSAYDIFHDILNKIKKRPHIGATPVETSLNVNDDGAINEAVGGGRKHPLYKKYRGLVVSIKKNKQKKTKKKRSPKKLLKNIRKEIKKRKRKGTQKENKKVEAWKLQEKKLSGGRRKTRKKRGGEVPVVGQIYQSKSEDDYPILQEGYRVTAVKENHVWFNSVEEKPVFERDDELIVTIAEFPDLFMSQQIQQPGGRKKKRKGRCTKKKRRRHR